MKMNIPFSRANMKEFYKCPPKQKLSNLLIILFCFVFLYLCLYCFDPHSALPGNCSSRGRTNTLKTLNKNYGNLFGLYVLFISAMVLGKLAFLMKLPPLLGMIIAGFLLRNISNINVVSCIEDIWNVYLRSFALLVILVRAGLGIDYQILKKLCFVATRLACIPCLTEAIIVSITSHFLISLSWGWSFILGFVLSAVSPAVVVPSVLELEKKGLGVDQGVNTLVVAAASIDDVFAITGFSMALAATFSLNDNLLFKIFRGPVEALAGVSFGIVVGFILWFLPSADNKESFMFYRIVGLFLSAIGGMFGATRFHMPSAGPLSVLTLSFVASIRWSQDQMWKNSDNVVRKTLEIAWWLLQPFLFGLIGAGLDVQAIKLGYVGYGVLTIFIGLIFRLLATFLVLFGTSFTRNEKLFVAFAWLPKATIQAAIGPLALDLAIKTNSSSQFIEHGEQVLTMAVISILMTAPLGAILISLFGPILLRKSSRVVELENYDTKLKIPAPETQRLYGDETDI